MHRAIISLVAASIVSQIAVSTGHAGQPPRAASDPDVAISHRDRVYAAEQFSNTVSVVDPASNKLLGVIRLGDPQPQNFSPLYHGQLLVHGMGFSPDGKTIAVVSIGSNAVTFIDTATNAVKATTYVGRSPHEAFFTPNGREVWITVRGEDYVAVLDPMTFKETGRIKVPNGPGMQIFSPDGMYAYVCSSFTPETVIISLVDRKIVGRVKQESPFCPNIAATPDGKQVWLTLKDVGRTMVFDARPPFAILKSLGTGPITNHVNFARTIAGTFAYVSIGGLDEVQVFRTDNFSQIATIPVGSMPHGIWPSGDGSRIYVGLENADALVAIDTATNKVIATTSVGQAPQAIAYVPNALSEGEQGLTGLEPLGAAARKIQLSLASKVATGAKAQTEVSLFEQGLTQVLQASVTGLEPRHPYVLALADHADGSGRLDPLATFTTNPAGAAIVNAVGPIRQIIQGEAGTTRKYLVIAPGTPDSPAPPVQVQTP